MVQMHGYTLYVNVFFHIHVATILYWCVVDAISDPCYNHKDLDDNKYATNNSVPRTNEGFQQNGWYRVTSTIAGVLVGTCPTDNECGTTSQVWMNGTIPDYASGEVGVTVCIRIGTECCERTRSLMMKNCNGFVVYHLVYLPGTTGYCFDSSESTHSTVPTSPTSSTSSTSATTILTTQIAANKTKNDAKSDGKQSSVVIAIGVSAVVATLLIAAGVATLVFINQRNKIADAQEVLGDSGEVVSSTNRSDDKPAVSDMDGN